MFNKIFKLSLILLSLYQSPSQSKSTSFEKFNSQNLSNYFSGIVALENKDNSQALKFFRLSKNILNKHDPYLKRYVTSLVLEKKVSQAINVIHRNRNKQNTNLFDAELLINLESLKKVIAGC